MFNREDLITYLSDIEITEINMKDLYSEAAKQIDDPEIVKKLMSLSSAEERHAKMVSKIKKEVMSLSIED